MFTEYIHVLFRQDFFMEANNINPDQTAPRGEQCDLGSYCLLYRLPKIRTSADERADDKNCDWQAGRKRIKIRNGRFCLAY